MDKNRYINDAAKHISWVILKNDALKGVQSPYPFGITVGSDYPSEPEHFEFINGLLDFIPEITYCLRAENNTIPESLQSYAQRIKTVSDTEGTYMGRCSFFIHFRADIKIKILMETGKYFHPGVPDKNISAEKSLSSLFLNYQSKKDWYDELFGCYEVSSTADIFFQVYKEALDNEGVQALCSNKYTGYAVYYERMRMYIKYPAMRETDLFFFTSSVRKAKPVKPAPVCGPGSFLGALGLDK